MSKAKSKIKVREFDTDSVFVDHLSDVRMGPATQHPENRDLEKELFGKKGAAETIDAFEEMVGIKPPVKQEKKQFYNKVLSPNYEADEKLLNELLNDPRYKILSWKDTWTVNGDYKVFVVYYKTIDPKKKEPTEEKIDE